VDVSEIKRAIEELSSENQWELLDWFKEYMADEWDKEIERDAAAGKFDKIVAKVDANFEAGRCTPL
jgi:hypothetical protein